MKKILKLPTILGLLFLVAGVVAGIFLINSTQVFKLGAQEEAAPKNVRVTNITDSSVTVTWTTETISKGFVKWGESKTVLSNVALENNSEKSLVHSVTITPIPANTEVFFKINSESTDWDNDGIAWQAKTLPQSSANDQGISATGSVVDQVGEPAKAAIVYINVEGTTLSTSTSTNGSWVIPISNYLSVDPDNTLLEISVNAAALGTATAVIYPNASKNTPLMVLGKTYDFRTLTDTASGEIPESELSIPESLEVSSRFETGGQEVLETNTEVTLESLEDGEIITTTDPEFFGSAPIGTEVEIVVESELQTGTTTAGANGSWQWNPPNNLDPGEHKVTVKWRDAAGILRTITRSFIVSAAEGPAFVSTPSATPLETVTPTLAPTTTPEATIAPTLEPDSTITPTASPIALPDSGTLTPTILLFIMGIGVLATSVFIWNKSDA